MTAFSYPASGPVGGFFIGLMSGTSLDGVDGVLVEISATGKLKALLAHAHRPFDPALRAELLALQTPGENELHRAALAGNALAAFYAQIVEALLASARIERADLAAVCEMLGVALQNVMRLAYAEQQGRILGGLCEISDRMSESVRLHDALGRALSRVLELVRGESGCIYVRHPGAEAFVLSARQSPPGLLVSEERAIAEGVGA